MPRKPPKEHQFKPGQSGNPNGRAKEPKEIRDARKLTKAEFTKIVTKYLFMSRDQIKEDVHSKDKNMLDLLVGGIVMKAVQKGDDKLATFLLDRVIGKVKDNLELDVSESLHTRIVDALNKVRDEEAK